VEGGVHQGMVWRVTGMVVLCLKGAVVRSISCNAHLKVSKLVPLLFKERSWI